MDLDFILVNVKVEYRKTLKRHAVKSPTALLGPESIYIIGTDKGVMCMGKDTKSRTKNEHWLLEAGEHYKTTISDGRTKVEGRDVDPEKSQEIASDKYNANDDDDDEDEDEDDEE